MAENLVLRVNSNEVIQNYGTTSIETYGATTVQDLSEAFPDTLSVSSSAAATHLRILVPQNTIISSAETPRVHLVIPAGPNNIATPAAIISSAPVIEVSIRYPLIISSEIILTPGIAVPILKRIAIVNQNLVTSDNNPITASVRIPVETNDGILTPGDVTVHLAIPTTPSSSVLTAATPTIHLAIRVATAIIEESVATPTVHQVATVVTNILTITNTTPGIFIGAPVASNNITSNAGIVRIDVFVPVATNTIVGSTADETVHLHIPVTPNTETLTNIPVSIHLHIPTVIALVECVAISPRIDLVIPAGPNSIAEAAIETISAPAITVSQRIPCVANILTSTANAITVRLQLAASLITLTPIAITVSQTVSVETIALDIAAPTAVAAVNQMILESTNILTILPPGSIETICSYYGGFTYGSQYYGCSAGAGGGGFLVHLTIPVTTNIITIEALAVTGTQTVPVETVTIDIVAPAITVSQTALSITNEISISAPAITVSIRYPLLVSCIIVIEASLATLQLSIPTPSNILTSTVAEPRIDLHIPTGETRIELSVPSVIQHLTVPINTSNIKTITAIAIAYPTIQIAVDTENIISSAALVRINLVIPAGPNSVAESAVDIIVAPPITVSQTYPLLTTPEIRLIASEEQTNLAVPVFVNGIESSAPSTSIRQTMRTDTNVIVCDANAIRLGRIQYLDSAFIIVSNYFVQVWKSNHDVVSGDITLTNDIAYVLPSLPEAKARLFREWRVEIRKNVWFVPTLPDYNPAHIFVDWVVPYHQTTWYVPRKQK